MSGDGSPNFPPVQVVCFGGERAGPGDVAVACLVERIGAFAEGPSSAGVAFAEGEIIGGDIVLAAGKAFLGGGELVHESETEVVFLAGEINGSECVAEA